MKKHWPRLGFILCIAFLLSSCKNNRSSNGGNTGSGSSPFSWKDRSGKVPFEGSPTWCFIIDEAVYINFNNYEIFKYTPKDNQWKQLTDLSSLSTKTAAFSQNGRGYLVGVQLRPEAGTLVGIYDPNDNTWKQDPILSSMPSGQVVLPAPRYNLTTFTVKKNNQEETYIGLGQTFSDAQDTFWKYHASTKQSFHPIFTEIAPYPEKQKNNFGTTQACTHNHTGYVGYTTANGPWHKYDAVANRWIKIANFSGAPRHFSTAFVIQGRPFVILGISCKPGNAALITEIVEYNPTNDAWITYHDKSFPTAAFNPYVAVLYIISFTVQDKVYVMYGNTDKKPTFLERTLKK